LHDLSILIFDISFANPKSASFTDPFA